MTRMGNGEDIRAIRAIRGLNGIEKHDDFSRMSALRGESRGTGPRAGLLRHVRGPHHEHRDIAPDRFVDAWGITWQLERGNHYFDIAVHPLRDATLLMRSAVEQLLAEAGDYIVVLITGDDLGSQKAPLLSTAMYRQLIKTYHAELFSAIKARSQAKIFHRSDGNKGSFICGSWRGALPVGRAARAQRRGGACLPTKAASAAVAAGRESRGASARSALASGSGAAGG
jgi:hypothetical protein